MIGSEETIMSERLTFSSFNEMMNKLRSIWKIDERMEIERLHNLVPYDKSVPSQKIKNNEFERRRIKFNRNYTTQRVSTHTRK